MKKIMKNHEKFECDFVLFFFFFALFIWSLLYRLFWIVGVRERILLQDYYSCNLICLKFLSFFKEFCDIICSWFFLVMNKNLVNYLSFLQFLYTHMKRCLQHNIGLNSIVQVWVQKFQFLRLIPKIQLIGFYSKTFKSIGLW